MNLICLVAATALASSVAGQGADNSSTSLASCTKPPYEPYKVMKDHIRICQTEQLVPYPWCRFRFRCQEVSFSRLTSLIGSVFHNDTNNCLPDNPKCTQTDGDDCCATIQCQRKPHVVQYPGTSDDCNVLQLPDVCLFQKQTEGTCGAKGNCRGSCDQMYQHVTHLVFCPNHGAKHFFDLPFEFISTPAPSYCSCRGT